MNLKSAVFHFTNFTRNFASLLRLRQKSAMDRQHRAFQTIKRPQPAGFAVLRPIFMRTVAQHLWCRLTAKLSPLDHFDNLVHDLALINSLGIRLVIAYGARHQIEQQCQQQNYSVAISSKAYVSLMPPA